MTRPSNIAYHPTALSLPGEQETDEPRPLRRPVARAGPALPARSDRQSDVRLCEEIETLRRYVETAGYLLGQDAALRYRYGTELGNLKHVDKTLGQVALVIAAADKEGAIDRLDDAELRARLQRKPIAPMFESKH